MLATAPRRLAAALLVGPTAVTIGRAAVIAENESTGVKVSDVNAEYYASRWSGAVRFR